MNTLTLPFLFALVIPTLAQQTTSLQVNPTLSEMRDRYRPLLIFAPTRDPRLHTQLELLTSNRPDLINRQIMLVPFPHKWAGPVDAAIMTFMNRNEADLRHHFHIQANDFTVILLGKDGDEKFRSHTPVTIEQLNHIIDAMPMRQAEMRTQHPD